MRRSRQRLVARRRDHGERQGGRDGLRGDTRRRAAGTRSARDRSRSLVARAWPDGRPHARPVAERRSRARRVPVRHDAIAGRCSIAQGRPLVARVAVPRPSRRGRCRGSRAPLPDRQSRRRDHGVPSARAHRVVRAAAAGSVRPGRRRPRAEGLPQFPAHRRDRRRQRDLFALRRSASRRAAAPGLARALRPSPRAAAGWRRGRCWAASRAGNRHGAASPEFRCSPARWTHGQRRWARVRSAPARATTSRARRKWPGSITPARADVPGLVSLLWGEKVWQIGGPTQAGADCASWCHRTLRVRGTLAAAVERAGKMSPHRDTAAVPALSRRRANAALACRCPRCVRGACARARRRRFPVGGAGRRGDGDARYSCARGRGIRTARCARFAWPAAARSRTPGARSRPMS